MTRRVAVLGGTGWLGRHVCRSFTSLGREIVVVARRPAPHTSTHSFVELDLLRAEVETLTSMLYAMQVGVVVNATDAANATDGWARTENEMAAMNVDVVHRVLNAVRALPWRPRLVHIGTIHEYGETPPGTAISESFPPVPTTPYTQTKLAGSEAVLHARDVDGVVLRSTNISGPHPSPASFPGKLVATLRTALAAQQLMKITITDASRDYVDVRDVADAVVKAAQVPCAGRVVNIGSSRAVDIRTLVRTFVVAAGYSEEILDEEIREVPSLGGRWTQADIGLAAELLGWRPRVLLEKSLQDMWNTSLVGR